MGGEGSIDLVGADEGGHPEAGCRRACGGGGHNIGLGILAHRPVGVWLGEGEGGIEIGLYTLVSRWLSQTETSEASCGQSMVMWICLGWSVVVSGDQAPRDEGQMLEERIVLLLRWPSCLSACLSVVLVVCSSCAATTCKNTHTSAKILPDRLRTFLPSFFSSFLHPLSVSLLTVCPVSLRSMFPFPYLIKQITGTVFHCDHSA